MTRLQSINRTRADCILIYLVGLDGGPRVEVPDDGVGVDGDEDVGHVGVDLVLEVALPDVVEQGGLVEVHEAAVVVHRLGVVIFGRVEAVEAVNRNVLVTFFNNDSYVICHLCTWFPLAFPNSPVD